MLAAEQLDELQRLYDVASLGEWGWHHNRSVLFLTTNEPYGKLVLSCQNDEYGDCRPTEHDAALIVAVHNVLPVLIEAARDGLRWRQFIAEIGPDIADVTIDALDWLRKIAADGNGGGKDA